MQVLAKELIDFHPDLILAVATSATVPLRQQTTLIPVVFVGVSDPVGLGVVESLAHPGGNVTGFTGLEFSIASKWLEVLKEIAPHLTRIGVLVDPKIPSHPMYLRAIETAPTMSLPLTRVDVGDAADISRAFDAFAGASADGLLVLPSPVISLIASKLLSPRRGSVCPRFTRTAISSRVVVWFPILLICSTSIGVPRRMSIASFGGEAN